jgi:hypothetical protein
MHLDNEEIIQYCLFLRGEKTTLTKELIEGIKEHLLWCQECQKQVDAMRGLMALTGLGENFPKEVN